MMIVFGILMVASFILGIFNAWLDRDGVTGICLALGAVAGILLSVVVSRIPSNDNHNSYLLYTIFVIFCAAIPTFLGIGIGEALRKKKGQK